MKQQKPFFKNSFKNLIKNKIQLISIIILVFVTSFIFTLSFSSSSRLSNSYNDFISAEQSNIHDFIIDLSNATFINDFQNDQFRTISDAEVRNNLIISYIQDQLIDTDLSFEVDRVEARSFSLSSGKNLKVFALNPEQNVSRVVVNNGMSLDLWRQYAMSPDNWTRRWVYVNEQFAQANNIRINDVIRLQDDEYGTTIRVEDSELQPVDIDLFRFTDINLWLDRTEFAAQNWFQVVGFASSADFSTPILDETRPLPNTRTEGLFYVSPLNFGINYMFFDSVSGIDNAISNISSKFDNVSNRRIWYTNGDIASLENLQAVSSRDTEIYFVGRFNNDVDIITASARINDFVTNLSVAQSINLYATFINSINPNGRLVTYRGSSEYRFAQRTTLLSSTIFLYRIFSYIIIIITMSIGITMLMVMLNNQIKKSFGQMGVLKALGYKNSSLIWSSSLFPLFITLIGGTFGLILGLSLQNIVINIFNGYFAINMQPFHFSWQSLLITILGIFILLEIITLIVYFSTMSKYNSLEMISYENKSATNAFKLAVKKIVTRRKTFNARFQGAMLSNSISKLIAVFNVMLVSSVLLTLGSLLPVILNENKERLYAGNNFHNRIEYQSPIFNSPVSFLQTFDPYSTISDVSEMNTQELINMYAQQNISADVFSASTDLSTLNNMAYRAFDIQFLQNMNLTIGDGTLSNPLHYRAVALNLWSDLSTHGFDIYWNREQFAALLNDDVASAINIEDLERIRQFYLKYQNTIGISSQFWREDYFISTPGGMLTSIINNNNWTGTGPNPFLSTADANDFNQTVQLTPSGAISGAIDFTSSLHNYINTPEWRSRRINIMMPIYNWFVALFHNNLQQALLQGIYSSSPQLVRERIATEFYKENGNFTIGFNLVPFNSETDDLGIYLNAVKDNNEFRIFGIKENNQTQELFDVNNNSLNQALFETQNAMVINQSLARRLRLSVGDEISVDHILKALKHQGETIEIESWDASQLDASNTDGYTNRRYLYNSSLLSPSQNNSDWWNETISSTQGIYQSSADPLAVNQTSPNVMSQNVADGSVSIGTIVNEHKYTIVGIHNQFGENQAWIDYHLAKSVSKFDQTQALLFEVFREEWRNPQRLSQQNQEFVNKLNDSNVTLESFREWTNSNEAREQYWRLFTNSYPIFNFKTSKNENISDFMRSISTTQSFGDFSMYGLNGGVSSANVVYSGFAAPTVTNVLVIEEALAIISRINMTINSVVYFIIAIAVVLSAVIILLIINLVIAQNSKVIAAMKILGYKESYIARLFIGIYIPVVVIASLLGFAIGWAIIYLTLINIIPSIVLPFTFQWWFILPGILLSWALYTISASMSWSSLKRISPLLAIQGG